MLSLFNEPKVASYDRFVYSASQYFRQSHTRRPLNPVLSQPVRIRSDSPDVLCILLRLALILRILIFLLTSTPFGYLHAHTVNML